MYSALPQTRRSRLVQRLQQAKLMADWLGPRYQEKHYPAHADRTCRNRIYLRTTFRRRPRDRSCDCPNLHLRLAPRRWFENMWVTALNMRTRRIAAARV